MQKGLDMVMSLTRMTGAFFLVLLLPAQGVMGATVKDIQAQGTAMMKDADEMVMHGGMGDTNAIVHHCGEVGHFESLR